MNRYKLIAGVFALDVILFAISGIPAMKDADSGVYGVIGYIGWFGGLAGALALIVLSVTTLAQKAGARRRKRPEAAR